MSVIIKGMVMPENCWDCPLCDSKWCYAKAMPNENGLTTAGRPDVCPLEEMVEGEWKCLGHVMGIGKHPCSLDFKCSVCGYIFYHLVFGPPDMCPQCGARMKRFEFPPIPQSIMKEIVIENAKHDIPQNKNNEDGGA